MTGAEAADPHPPDADRAAVYRLTPGLDVVPVGDDVVLAADGVRVRLEGASAGLFRDRVLPLLDGTRTLGEVAAAVPGVAVDDLRRHLDALVKARVLLRDRPPAGADPFLRFLDAAGMPEPSATAHLGALRVAIVGLEGPGAHAAACLAASGVGALVLADPYPCQPANLPLMPALGAPGGGAVGTPRQQVMAAALAAGGGPTRVEVAGPEPLGREAVAALCDDADLVVACLDRGLSSANHWLNAASVATGVPALYAELRGPTALVGPLVVPGETACYLCWRMRAIACDDDFQASMAVEELRDRQREPVLHERGALPALSAVAGGMVAIEALKHLLGIGVDALVARVHEIDVVGGRSDVHQVLAVPDCPTCKKKKPSRAWPPLDRLIAGAGPAGDILALEPVLVSARCGVVKLAQEIPKDVSEPERPYVWRAELANHSFAPKPDPEQTSCTGKGMTRDAARATALGEAVERYSAGCWDDGEIVVARRDHLDAPSLDPRALVLYRDEQYAEVPYAPYDPARPMGWVPARALAGGGEVLVPALAVFMNYHPSPGEHLFQPTSNGLGTGPTPAAAVLSALLEVMERDAFVIAWMNRLPATRFDPASHPDPDVVGLCQAFERRGVAVHLLALPTDHPASVFLSLAVDERGERPAAAVGLGADVDPAAAARKAALELGQIRPALRASLRRAETRARVDALVADPTTVTDLDDHDLLYTDPRMLSSFDFLLAGPAGEFAPARAGSPGDRLRLLVDHFGAAGNDVLACDLTTPEMGRLGLSTARVIVPELQPIHFGWKESRLGGTRLFELPHRLGLTPAPTTPAGLNQDPHPLA